ncbi:hypothetical protein FHS18_006334 [Paenibacillus phyllosphaerae]|uniref:Copper amine oxidase-like N-terminal domain-containing protein n=1 Tax=Paenibacillus phyllosphaerae TaxID=274593 RepID=A0A7W5B4E8_9BACL|nr:copper amine oxidase N-terminal domain-containing protein [Paenibacillus phyllosphaerae]MBB3114215.1 hypothetical protein [Paenibacillus phyllosphaerae]
MLKRVLVVLTMVSMILGLIPAVAGAATNNTVVVQLTVGSPTVTINGATSTIQKPYVVNGTTLVPLSVITKAFGAGLTLNKKVITLTYNNKKVVLTIGSKTVVVDGKAATVAVAPTVVNNTTMVPLRVITTAFGAAISSTGKQIVIVGMKAGAAETTTGGGTATGGINIDSGKTKVGDSYFGWSMSYPSNLTLAEQSDNGDYVVWSDINENAILSVGVQDVGETYTKEELRTFMIERTSSDAFVIEKKTINTNGQDFEKLVVKTRDGLFLEYRAIQKDTKIYTIIAGVKAATRDALNSFSTVLDSFTLTFSSSDASIKDITKVKDGYVVASDLDYGLTVQLPVGWDRDEDSYIPSFGNEDGYFLDFYVHSSESGETASDWMKKERLAYENNFVAEYRRNSTESTVAIDNGQASVFTTEYTFDQKEWFKSYDVYYVEGNHKYWASLMFPAEDGAKGDAIIQQIISTLSIATEYVEENFSEIEEDDLTGLVVRKTSKEYGYSIELPQSWYGVRKDFEEDTVVYGIGSIGIFTINAVGNELSASEFTQAISSMVSQDADYAAAKASVKEQTSVTINGVQAYKIVVEFKEPGEDSWPFVQTFYAFEKNGNTVIVNYLFNIANNTQFNRDIADKAVQSFMFTS